MLLKLGVSLGVAYLAIWAKCPSYNPDKGDSVVILLMDEYLELAHEHLNDKVTCQPLGQDPTQKISHQFIQYLSTCKKRQVQLPLSNLIS